MKKTYDQLEKSFVKYCDLVRVKTRASKESLVSLKDKDILCGYKKEMADMKQYTGDDILVRKTVATLLQRAEKTLQKENPSWRLYVTYGYRNLIIQTKKFQEILGKVTKDTFYEDPIALYEKVHQSIAVPTVAGHPTGGAVDILIYDTKKKAFVDFGSKQYDFLSKECYTYAPDISTQGKKNRALLRSVMVSVGFAPYDAEWWHFSYGDKEWAFYYKKPYALYKQLSE